MANKILTTCDGAKILTNCDGTKVLVGCEGGVPCNSCDPLLDNIYSVTVTPFGGGAPCTFEMVWVVDCTWECGGGLGAGGGEMNWNIMIPGAWGITSLCGGCFITTGSGDTTPTTPCDPRGTYTDGGGNVAVVS